MIQYKEFLVEFNNKRNALEEYKAGFTDHPPAILAAQIRDYQEAIDLTNQAIAGEITETQWNEAINPLIAELAERETEITQLPSSDVETETTQPSQTVINQQGQTIQGDQYVAAGNIHITTTAEEPSLWRRLSHLNILISLLVGLAIISITIVFFLNLPSTSPVSKPSGPELMYGDINIVIATPLIPASTTVDQQIRRFQTQYTNELSTTLATEFADYGDLLELNQEFRVVEILVEDIDQRHEIMAAYAEDVRADIVLYGKLDNTIFSPEFYIHPRFAVLGSELTGPNAVGGSIYLPFSGQGGDQIAIKETLKDALPHLAAFVGALGLFQFGTIESYDRAQTSFEELIEEAWATEEGKAVLYLWLGTTHFKKAMYLQARRQPEESVYCFVEGGEVKNDATCARLSYERAKDINEDFPRAHIGLGNYYLELEKHNNCQRFDNAERSYLNAETLRTGLSDDDAEFAEIALVEQNILYHLGFTYAQAFYEGCDKQDYKDDALSTFGELVDHYEQVVANEEQAVSSKLRDLTSRAYYMMALVERWAGNDDQALRHFMSTQDVALIDHESDQANLDRWQTIYWIAGKQIGDIYLTQYERGGDTFDAARIELNNVVDAIEKPVFARLYRKDPFVVSAAWYSLGRLYSARAKRNEAVLDKDSLMQAENAYRQSIDVVQETLKNDPHLVYSQEDGLPWISHLNLADLYLLWATTDPDKADDALDQYEVVLNAINTSKLKADRKNEVRNVALIQTYLGLGKIHLMDGAVEEAREDLEVICRFPVPGSTIVQEADALLKQISDELGCHLGE